MREPPEIRITPGANGSANYRPRFRSSETQHPDEANARQHSNPPATIKIILEPVNRRGRSSASLPDGTVLVGSSRQPFLDAARVLIAAGYDPDSWLEGWRPGSTAFALRARLGVASGLTVDETRTVFAPWKPFSPSAVSPSIRHPEEAATITPAAASSALLQPPLEQPSGITSPTELSSPGTPSADELKDRARSGSTFDDCSSRPSRA